MKYELTEQDKEFIFLLVECLGGDIDGDFLSLSKCYYPWTAVLAMVGPRTITLERVNKILAIRLLQHIGCDEINIAVDIRNNYVSIIEEEKK